MSRLRLLKSSAGDLTLAEWESGSTELIDCAKDAFRREFTGGRLAYRVLGPGAHEVIRSAEDIDWGIEGDVVLVPAIQGG